MTASVPALAANLLHTPRARFTDGAAADAPASAIAFGTVQPVNARIHRRENRRFDLLPCYARGVATDYGDSVGLGAALAVSGAPAYMARAVREPAARVRLRRQTP